MGLRVTPPPPPRRAIFFPPWTAATAPPPRVACHCFLGRFPAHLRAQLEAERAQHGDFVELTELANETYATLPHGLPRGARGAVFMHLPVLLGDAEAAEPGLLHLAHTFSGPRMQIRRPLLLLTRVRVFVVAQQSQQRFRCAWRALTQGTVCKCRARGTAGDKTARNPNSA